MSDQPMAKSACEHYWAYHCYGGLSVRLCQLCHEPDWNDVRRNLAEAWDEGQAAENYRLRPLVGMWRTAAEALAGNNALWSSHFYDCANELNRLLEQAPPGVSP